MHLDSLYGAPWWALLLLVAACWIIVVLARKSAARTRKREAAEQLAQRADANHEGARTRHEGGA